MGPQRHVKRLARPQHSGQIHVHNAVPVRFGHLSRGLALGLAGCVQQHIDAPEPRQHRVTKAVDGLAGTRVARMSQRLAALALDLQARLFDQRLPPSRRHNIRARGSQARRQFAAEARSASDHYHYASGQVHRVLGAHDCPF